MPSIRNISLALIRRADGKVLLEKGYDRVKDEYFYRALGGGIEFGETAIETVKREFVEELGIEISVGVLLATIENIFTFDGKPGHEIVFIHECRLADAGLEQQEKFSRIDDSTATPEWVDITRVDIPVYPQAFMNLVKKSGE